jgi:hypothetical protein
MDLGKRVVCRRVASTKVLWDAIVGGASAMISGHEPPTQRPCRRACSARNCEEGPPSASPRSSRSVANPVENVSVRRISRAPAKAAAATIGAR